MSSLTVRLRRELRDLPLARAAVVRLRTLGRPAGGSPDGVLFLFYHHVPAASRGSFARQLRALRGLADIVGPHDALRLLAEGAPGGRVGGRYVCITLDDGYRDAFEHGVPILAEQQVPAAFFVVPGWMDAGRPDIFGWDECRALLAAGMTVGSHSSTHRRFSLLTAAEAEAEIVQSRQRIETMLGVPCRHFACPWGQPGEDYVATREPALARAAGYGCFFTTIARRARAGDDAWMLPRVRMEPGWGEADLRYAFQR